MSRFKRRTPPLCECGCGEKVRMYRGEWNRFVFGHNNPMQGRKHSKETLRKMSKIKTGKRHSKETCQKLSEINIGKKLSIETKRRIAIASAGRKHTAESKKKMSIVHTGRIFSKEHRRNISIALRGKEISIEAKRKMALANTGQRRTIEQIEKMSGPNHYNWKGGIATAPYCSIWSDNEYKQSIKDRDNNECQNKVDCRENSDHLPLHLHHIDHDKQECNPWDLITVCYSCNSRANFNKEYWKNFYQGIMMEKYGYEYS